MRTPQTAFRVTVKNVAVIAQLKKDMDFYRGLGSLLGVLKGIAVSQFHILERKLKTFDKFSYAVESFIEGIDTSSVIHPFLQSPVKNQAVIGITSDSGLLGGLNTQVMNMCFSQLQNEKDILVIVGERGKIYAQEMRIPYKGFPGIKDETRFDLALTLRDYVLKKVVDQEVGGVSIIYPKALSLINQKLEKFSPLPYGKPENKEDYPAINLKEFIQESSLEDMVEYLVFLWMGQKIYDILGYARLAELGARFIHLEESSHKLGDLDKKLRLKYFRFKHELTDRSMREIFAARSISAGK